ncbi:MAG: sulfotransferase family protein [Solirubrobacterales bacterium]
MPNFLIIGAQKAGTTSVYRYLRQHPEIYMSPLKEPRFFAFEGENPDFHGPFRRDPDTPLAGRPRGTVTELEPYRALYAGVADETAVGEASPQYLYSEKAPGRIRHHLPDAKLIAILRDPAERAYSHFLMARREGHEPLTDFARALEAEEGRVRANWWIGHYKRMGYYHQQLSRYCDLFEPDQIRVYLYEDLGEDPVGTMRGILRFLGVDESLVPDTYVRHNVSGTPRSRALHTLISKPNPLKRAVTPFLPDALRKRIFAGLRDRNLVASPPIPEAAREELTEAYRDDVLQLQRLIGRDLSGWLGERP